MLRLKMDNKPVTVDLGAGVTFDCLPMNSAVFAAARSDPAVPRISAKYLKSTNSGDLVDDLDYDADDGGVDGQTYTVELVKAIARRVVTGWTGIGDVDGKPIDNPTPEAINALMDEVWFIYERFNEKYVAPFLLVQSEGNDSAPLPNGSMAGARNTAKTAKKSAQNVHKG